MELSDITTVSNAYLKCIYRLLMYEPTDCVMKLHCLCNQKISEIQILTFLWWFQVIYYYQPSGVLTNLPPPNLWSSPLITNLSVFSRVAINVSTQSHQLQPDSNKIVHISYKALPSVRQIMPNHIICFCLYLDHFPSFLPNSFPFIVLLFRPDRIFMWSSQRYGSYQVKSTPY